jgi:hypothetical protein
MRSFDLFAEKEKITGIDELKMIYGGKLLDNAKSFAELQIPTNNQVRLCPESKLVPYTVSKAVLPRVRLHCC